MTGRASTPPGQADLAPAPATAISTNQTALPPDHDLASGDGAADGEAPDADDIATMHTPELIGGDVTHCIPVLRQIWWSHRGLGYRYPAQPGIILIDGGKP